MLEKLAALTPRPRINLILYHGVLAPHARWRAQVGAYGYAIQAVLAEVFTLGVKAGVEPLALWQAVRRGRGRPATNLRRARRPVLASQVRTAVVHTPAGPQGRLPGSRSRPRAARVRMRLASLALEELTEAMTVELSPRGARARAWRRGRSEVTRQRREARGTYAIQLTRGFSVLRGPAVSDLFTNWLRARRHRIQVIESVRIVLQHKSCFDRSSTSQRQLAKGHFAFEL
jgi:hypothetical protein